MNEAWIFYGVFVLGNPGVSSSLKYYFFVGDLDGDGLKTLYYSCCIWVCLPEVNFFIDDFGLECVFLLWGGNGAGDTL
jgi:hypothetical protein